MPLRNNLLLLVHAFTMGTLSTDITAVIILLKSHQKFFVEGLGTAASGRAWRPVQFKGQCKGDCSNRHSHKSGSLKVEEAYILSNLILNFTYAYPGWDFFFSLTTTGYKQRWWMESQCQPARQAVWLKSYLKKGFIGFRNIMFLDTWNSTMGSNTLHIWMYFILN